MRVVCAGAVLAALSSVLTGCGVPQNRSAAIELSPVTPSPSGASASSTPADTSSCFDVAEAFSALELLPLTDQAEDEDRDDDALDRARDSAARVRGRLPAAVQPAFDDVRGILDRAGDTLQPAEAVQVHKALEPAESWLQGHCAGTPTG
ncbi:hypothetical protein C1C97_007170 [Kocuria tytonis]|uniref:Uncharacterized protein n=2 Tax=Kocuria tytonis TaxID=2054280 RepID=A0A495A960_9MICC|nr:hypothetical protein C1C97_007170 [Kocuria tytonis]